MVRNLLFSLVLGLAVIGCTTAEPPPPEIPATELADLPTRASLAEIPTLTPTAPPTWTPAAAQIASDSFVGLPTSTPRPPTLTPAPLPTKTATPTLLPSLTPSITPSPTTAPYRVGDPLPLDLYPRPINDNGWGIHWVPTVSQSPEVVDRFVNEAVRMHIKWVVFLNDNTQIGDNDYLVDRLVANGIMPVMRLYRDSVLPYDGELGPMVRHYRARGVFYFQLYNEPNVNIENRQSFANPFNYAVTWAAAARDVVNNGGYPGIAALSPGGEFNHLEFYERTLESIVYNGDGHLLNTAWISLHNYHGLRAPDDIGGFLMFREYDRITREELGRSLPIIGTEGGSYSDDPQVMTDMLAWQYRYMKDAEEYYFAFSYWLIANRAGGGWDDAWEWQTLFRPGWTHPVVNDFFYQNAQ